MAMIDLHRFPVVIFETDGVLAGTDRVHAAAWKRVFDTYLRQQPGLSPHQTRPFDVHDDYLRHVDGKLRLDGARDFLASRGIVLPEGPDGNGTLVGLGCLKDVAFLAEIRHDGVAVFPAAPGLARELRRRGAHLAAVSASRNGAEILARAALADLFDAGVDGADAARLRLATMPDPAMLAEAAHRLHTQPHETAVVAVTRPALQAAWRGRFGLVIALHPYDRAHTTPEPAANQVVHDLAEIQVTGRTSALGAHT